MIGPAGAGCGLIGATVFLVSGFLGGDWTAGFLVVATTCWKNYTEEIKKRARQVYLCHILKKCIRATFKTR